MKYVCKVCGYVHEGEGAIDTCPKCKQQVRVPRGKGKIAITCPQCREKFIKKT